MAVEEQVKVWGLALWHRVSLFTVASHFLQDFYDNSSPHSPAAPTSVSLPHRPSCAPLQVQGAALRQEMAQLRSEVGVASSSSEAAVGQANGLAIKLRT